MSFTFFSSQHIIWKAGKGASTEAIASGALLVQWADEAEAYILAQIQDKGYDFLTNYSLLDAQSKKVLQDAGSSLAAMMLIQYDMSGYTSLAEAQTMLDVHADRSDSALKFIKDKDFTDWIKP